MELVVRADPEPWIKDFSLLAPLGSSWNFFSASNIQLLDAEAS